MSVEAPYYYAEEDGEMALMVTKSISAPKVPAQGLTKRPTSADSDDDGSGSMQSKPFLTYWRTERERKALMLNRIEQTRLDVSVWSINRARTIAERSLSHDIKVARQRWSRFIPSSNPSSRSSSAPPNSTRSVSTTASLPQANGKEKRSKTAKTTNREEKCLLCSRIRELIDGKSSQGLVESPLCVIDLVRIQAPVAEDLLTLYAQHIQVCPENTNTSGSSSKKNSSQRIVYVDKTEILPRSVPKPIQVKRRSSAESDIHPNAQDLDRATLNWKMYNFLRRQRLFNVNCSVAKNVAAKTENLQFKQAGCPPHISLFCPPPIVVDRFSVATNGQQKLNVLEVDRRTPRRTRQIRWSTPTL